MSKVVALLTAAGASTRMGSPKALVPFSEAGGPEKPLLRHQLETLSASPLIAETVVVLGSNAETIRLEASSWGLEHRVHLVDNSRWQEGRSASFEVGGAFISGLGTIEAVLVAAVDQPLIVSVFEGLISNFKQSLNRPEVLVPTCEGRRGHPILLSGVLLPQLCNISVHPDGLRSLVRGARGLTLEVGDPRIFRDLNTPADLVY